MRISSDPAVLGDPARRVPVEVGRRVLAPGGVVLDGVVLDAAGVGQEQDAGAAVVAGVEDDAAVVDALGDVVPVGVRGADPRRVGVEELEAGVEVAVVVGEVPDVRDLGRHVVARLGLVPGVDAGRPAPALRRRGSPSTAMGPAARVMWISAPRGSSSAAALPTAERTAHVSAASIGTEVGFRTPLVRSRAVEVLGHECRRVSRRGQSRPPSGDIGRGPSRESHAPGHRGARGRAPAPERSPIQAHRCQATVVDSVNTHQPPGGDHGEDQRTVGTRQGAADRGAETRWAPSLRHRAGRRRAVGHALLPVLPDRGGPGGDARAVLPGRPRGQRVLHVGHLGAARGRRGDRGAARGTARRSTATSRRGQIEILDYSRVVHRGPGGSRPTRCSRAGSTSSQDARRRGFDGLRLTGNTFWLEQDSWDGLHPLRGSRSTQVIGQHRMIALCTYSLERCGVREIMDVVDEPPVRPDQAGRPAGRSSSEPRTARPSRQLRGERGALPRPVRGHDRGLRRCTRSCSTTTACPCDYRFLEVNPAFERLTGLSREAVLGRTVREVLPGIEPRLDREHYGRVALTGRAGPASRSTRDPSAATSRSAPSRPRQGQFAVLFTDVTERRRAEEKTAWLASFPEQNPNPVVEVDLPTRAVSYANPAAGARFPELVRTGPPPPVARRGRGDRRRARGDRHATSTWREVQVGESWCRQSSSAWLPGQVLRVYGIDITDRVLAEQAAEAARVRGGQRAATACEAVMEALPVGVAIVDSRAGTSDPTGPTTTSGVVRARSLGRSTTTLSYRAWWVDSGRPVEPEEWASARAVRHGETVVGQLLEIERFDGTRAFVHNSAAPFLDAERRGRRQRGGDPRRHRAPQEGAGAGASQRAPRAGAAVGRERACGSGTWRPNTWSGRRSCTACSASTRPRSRRPPSTPGASVLHPADRQAAEERISQALRDRLPLESEYRIVLPDGEVRWVNALGDTTCDPQRHGPAAWPASASTSPAASRSRTSCAGSRSGSGSP